MPGNAVLIDQRNEVGGPVAAERGLGEMRVRGNIAVGRGLEVGEIAPATTGNQDLLSGFVGMVDHQHPPAPLPGHCGAHQSGTPGTKDNDVIALGVTDHGLLLSGAGGHREQCRKQRAQRGIDQPVQRVEWLQRKHLLELR